MRGRDGIKIPTSKFWGILVGTGDRRCMAGEHVFGYHLPNMTTVKQFLIYYYFT